MSDINRPIEPTNWIKFTADLLEDKRIKRIMKKFGASQGLGLIVFVLIKLRKENEYKYPVVDIDLLSDEIGVSELDINTIVKESELFKITECTNYFYCPSLNYWMEKYDKKKIQTSEAGKVSALKRKLEKEKLLNDKNSKSTNVATNVEHLSSVRNTEEEVEEEVEVTTTKIINIKAKDAMPIYKSIITDGKDFTYQYNRFKTLNQESKRTVDNWKRWCMQIKKFEKQIAS